MIASPRWISKRTPPKILEQIVYSRAAQELSWEYTTSLVQAGMELGQGTSRAQQLIKESRLVVDGLPEYTVNDGVACDRNEEEVGRVHELLHKSDRELYQEKYTEFVPFNGKRDNRSCTTTLWLEPSRRK